MNDKSKNYVKGTNVYLLGDIDDSIRTEVLPSLIDLLDAPRAKNPNINIFINSSGGSVYLEYALLDIIYRLQKTGYKITTNILGYAASAATAISVVGDDRLATHCAEMVIHYGKQYPWSTTPTVLDNETTRVQRLHDSIIAHYTKYTNLKGKELRERLRDDYLIDAQTALAEGFVDGLILPGGEILRKKLDK